jgi:hypothetical protein
MRTKSLANHVPSAPRVRVEWVDLSHLFWTGNKRMPVPYTTIDQPPLPRNQEHPAECVPCSVGRIGLADLTCRRQTHEFGEDCEYQCPQGNYSPESLAGATASPKGPNSCAACQLLNFELPTPSEGFSREQGWNTYRENFYRGSRPLPMLRLLSFTFSDCGFKDIEMGTHALPTNFQPMFSQGKREFCAALSCS